MVLSGAELLPLLERDPVRRKINVTTQLGALPRKSELFRSLRSGKGSRESGLLEHFLGCPISYRTPSPERRELKRGCSVFFGNGT